MSEYVKYRREFHKYPEPGWEGIRTSARAAEIPAGIELPVKATERIHRA